MSGGAAVGKTRPATSTVVPAFIILLVGLAASGFAETSSFNTDLKGLVSDELGQPLVGATVSVFGKNLSRGALTAVTDEMGRFEVAGIPPGMYRLRAYLSGFLPSAFARVVIEDGMERVSSILMSLSRLEPLEHYGEETGEARTFSELRWIIQHGDRNILKGEEERAVAVADAYEWEENPGFDPEFALSGEFGIRAATYDEGLEEFPGAGAGLDARLAYARLFIPTNGDAHWLVSAQLLESALSSWAGRAEYVSSDLGGHRLSTGVTYGNFLYGDLEEFRPPEAVLGPGPADNLSALWFGSVYSSDTFLMGPATVEAGIAFQYFDYLDRAAYASPKLEVSYPLGSGERTLLRGIIDHRLQAPGGEDLGLLSQVAYSHIYGPTPARRALRAESTARFGVGLEHQLSNRTRVALRVFQENASDQLVKAFLEDEIGGGAGHFVVANQGDFRTRGLGVALFQALGPMEGSVGYTFGKSEGPAAAALSVPLGEGGEVPSTDPKIHDLTTTVATSIDRTQTRLQAAYRLIYHPGLSPTREGFSNTANVDSRFSIQLFQLLPFVGWNGTQWELMVAVRNLFYDDIANASILDEISVVEAPRRVLGGVTVRF
ncbi:MAG: TonB-dependent receptor [Vicinamibacteria bacterium]